MKDGGAAFPTFSDEILDEGSTQPSVHHIPGMSLRDYFAAAALQGICASAAQGRHELDLCPAIAIAAFRYADAMIARREK